MKIKPLSKNKKDLNSLSSDIYKMKNRGGRMSKLKGVRLIKAIKEAQKDPEFMREVDMFIKATT